MEPRLQGFLIALSIVIMISIFYNVKNEKLELKYAIIWIVIGIVLVVMAIFPSLLEVFANIIGIFIPANALFLLGILFNMLILFSMTVALSRESGKIKRLAQEVSILKLEIFEQKRQIDVTVTYPDK